MKFNRKERLQIAKKFKMRGRLSKDNINWRFVNKEKRKQREENFLAELEEREQRPAEYHDNANTGIGSKHNQEQIRGNQRTWYSLSVALPGSILDNVQTEQLKAYVAGQLARTFAIFCLDEVIVFDETATMTQLQINKFSDRQNPVEPDFGKLDCNFYMARIFEYLECPQYLRKTLFPIQRYLKHAGLMNPLDAMHHLRAYDQQIPYREGVVLDLPYKKGQFCDVGLDKRLKLTADRGLIPPFTRVTVKMETVNKDSKKLRGCLTSAEDVRSEAGIYWGYKVRIAKCISEVIAGEYDIVIGTSEKGRLIDEMGISPKNNCKVLVVFGGLNGLETAVSSDKTIRVEDPNLYFPNYINCLPDQGSHVIRTEEAIPITLTALKSKLSNVVNKLIY